MSKSTIYKIICFAILTYLFPLLLGFIEGFFCIYISIFHEIGRATFGSREIMWVVLTLFSASGGLILNLIWQKNEKEENEIHKKKKLRNKLILGLQQELVSNFNSIFKNKLNSSIESTFYDEIKGNMDFIPDKPLFNHVITIYAIAKDYRVALELYRDNHEKLTEEKFNSMHNLWLFLIELNLVDSEMLTEVEKRYQSIIQLRNGQLITNPPMNEDQRKRTLNKKYKDSIELLSTFYFKLKKKSEFVLIIYSLVVEIIVKEDQLKS
ncbi:MAG: hypothetical protein ABIM99_05720 [Candidatus Dojkabacteria bacterium]